MLNHKVLVAIPCLLLGGTEYQTLNLIKVLIEEDYCVTVLCYFEYDMAMIKYIKDTGANVVLMSASGIRPQKFSKLFLLLFLGINKVLLQIKPDVVHVQYMAPGSLAILLFKLLGVKKIIATAHVPGHIYKMKWMPRLISRYFTDCFLCVSKSSEVSFFNQPAQLFSKQSFAVGRKHFTIYNCSSSDSRYVKVSQNKSFTIGVVSRLSREKAIDIILSAMPIILYSNPNVKLLIVGDGAEKEKLVKQALKLEIVEAIEWVGLQTKDKLVTYYSQMDIVAVPSRFEGFGLTALEAMGYGIPVVASAVDGLNEVIEDQISGVLVKKDNPELLAKAILELINNDSKREAIAVAGKQRVDEQFSFNKYKQRISDLYQMLLAGNH